jgi:NADPH:quinone reductase-like Zn-dependent oxidoreductase
MFDEMNKAIELSGMRPVVDRVFGFGEVAEAMRFMEGQGHFGKICIHVQ